MINISLSTIKKGKVYGILLIEDPHKINPTREQFKKSVINWAHGYFSTLLSIFVAVEPDLYSMVAITDINNDHEDFQKQLEIPLVI